MLKVTTKAKI